MSLELIFLLFLLGLLSGFSAGLLGVGGSGVLIPFLTIIYSAHHFPHAYVVHMAIATGLGTVFFTSVSSLYAHYRQGDVVWRIVWLFLPGLFVGAWLGPLIASLMNTKVLATTYSLFLLFSAYRIARKPKQTKTDKPLPKTPAMIGVGTIIGTYGGLIGSTGTSITVPFLTTHSLKMNQAVGVAAAMGVPVAFIGSLSNIYHGWSVPLLPAHSLGFIYAPAVICLAAGSILAAPFGAKLSKRLSDHILKIIFALMLVGLSAYMLLKALH
ncbi:MAG TPA: sulfite exporter TauE/SafE family protein [Burkholderiaceae bacterium]|nr:sulfite exporter TauE/SafE family protein [Burkholderiaceae bacterium]